jgi:hypothetical protein
LLTTSAGTTLLAPPPLATTTTSFSLISASLPNVNGLILSGSIVRSRPKPVS